MKSMHPGTPPPQITQSQQVGRISGRREQNSAVSARKGWGALPLQPLKITRNFADGNERRTGCFGRLAEGMGLKSNLLHPETQ